MKAEEFVDRMKGGLIVKCLGSASGAPLGFEGQYLKSYDLEAHSGVGFCEFTADPDEALRFPDMAAFGAAYRQSPAGRPIREDGQPNRPLTSTHWEILTWPI